MNHKTTAAAVLAALLALPIAAHAQTTLSAATKQAFLSAASATKLAMPVALFVVAKAEGYGMYDARPTNVFKPGEPLVFYIEPEGYGFRTTGDVSQFGVTMDIELRADSGVVLYRKDAFLDQDFTSHHANQEFMLNGNVNINGADTGKYLLVLTLHDKIGAATATTNLPFTIQ